MIKKYTRIFKVDWDYASKSEVVSYDNSLLNDHDIIALRFESRNEILDEGELLHGEYKECSPIFHVGEIISSNDLYKMAAKDVGNASSCYSYGVTACGIKHVLKNGDRFMIIPEYDINKFKRVDSLRNIKWE